MVSCICAMDVMEEMMRLRHGALPRAGGVRVEWVDQSYVPLLPECGDGPGPAADGGRGGGRAMRLRSTPKPSGTTQETARKGEEEKEEEDFPIGSCV
ncbi:hypothetical protein FQA47_017465 [Oryzias melastigma]|uniref:Uncharacterized protein n=1 Tax=Oryzias melastigma TaxID=30732 RepID=A0A834FM11_ORYME|nr:hypothetical protein FQA47_017465 [Oryzias melastigma]